MGLKRVEYILSVSFSSERRNLSCPSFRASGTVPGIILCSLAQPCPAFRICSPRSPPGFSVHRIIPKNTGVGCHSLLQGIFLTQGSNLCLLHWQADSLPLSHLGSPKEGTHTSNSSTTQKRNFKLRFSSYLKGIC